MLLLALLRELIPVLALLRAQAMPLLADRFWQVCLAVSPHIRFLSAIDQRAGVTILETVPVEEGEYIFWPFESSV